MSTTYKSPPPLPPLNKFHNAPTVFPMFKLLTQKCGKVHLTIHSTLGNVL